MGSGSGSGTGSTRGLVRRLGPWAIASMLALVVWLSVASAAFAAPVQPKDPPTVLVLGDSLSAAYGLDASRGWVSLLNERLRTSHPRWRVVNASISGETTAGGASRIAGELQRNRPAVVVIELGANDGLRGLQLAQSRANLERMIAAAKAAKAQVLLIGMRMPPNLGKEYTQGFERNFRELANQHGTALLPFLLEPIALDRAAFQADNLHPIASAQPKLRDHVWTRLGPMLK